jgi:hypothetical protein
MVYLNGRIWLKSGLDTVGKDIILLHIICSFEKNVYSSKIKKFPRAIDDKILGTKENVRIWKRFFGKNVFCVNFLQRTNKHFEISNFDTKFDPFLAFRA